MSNRSSAISHDARFYSKQDYRPNEIIYIRYAYRALFHGDAVAARDLRSTISNHKVYSSAEWARERGVFGVDENVDDVWSSLNSAHERLSLHDAYDQHAR